MVLETKIGRFTVFTATPDAVAAAVDELHHRRMAAAASRRQRQVASRRPRQVASPQHSASPPGGLPASPSPVRRVASRALAMHTARIDLRALRGGGLSQR